MSSRGGYIFPVKQSSENGLIKPNLSNLLDVHVVKGDVVGGVVVVGKLHHLLRTVQPNHLVADRDVLKIYLYYLIKCNIFKNLIYIDSKQFKFLVNEHVTYCII